MEREREKLSHLIGDKLYRVTLIVVISLGIVDSVLKIIIEDVYYNYGISFGIGSETIIDFGFIHAVLFLFIAIYILIGKDIAIKKVLLLFIIGSFSNFYDRIILGAVVDYIYLLNLKFNLSDVAVNISIIYAIVSIIKSKENKDEEDLQNR